MAENHRRSIIFSILSILLFFFTATAFAATYEYDDLNRLKKYVSAGIETDYTYDENGNRESKAVIGLPPSASIQINTITNEVALTVTAGVEIVDSVYIDWLDGSQTANGADIKPGAGRVYNHTYVRDRLYRIRLKIRSKTGVYHYLTVEADVR